jgi:hypothetical protein
MKKINQDTDITKIYNYGSLQAFQENETICFM